MSDLPISPADREAARERVVHLPSGREGTFAEDRGDRVCIEWDAGYASNVDREELRYLHRGVGKGARV